MQVKNSVGYGCHLSYSNSPSHWVFYRLVRQNKKCGSRYNRLPFQSVEGFFVIVRIFFSALKRGTMISWPQPRHFNLKSAPVRNTRHCFSPQGWAFFIVRISPICTSILLPLNGQPVLFCSLFQLIITIGVIVLICQFIGQVLLLYPVMREIVGI